MDVCIFLNVMGWLYNVKPSRRIHSGRFLIPFREPKPPTGDVEKKQNIRFVTRKKVKMGSKKESLEKGAASLIKYLQALIPSTNSSLFFQGHLSSSEFIKTTLQQFAIHNDARESSFPQQLTHDSKNRRAKSNLSAVCMLKQVVSKQNDLPSTIFFALLRSL